VLAGALELPDGEQAAYLDRQADTPSLRAQVESLLALRGDAERFLERVPAPDRLERAGPYRLEREIGHRGMGTVYLAERDDSQFRKTVAVKFIPGALRNAELERRSAASAKSWPLSNTPTSRGSSTPVTREPLRTS
jgi:serine/threonine protein kinase